MRIGIDARVPHGCHGGVEQFVVGLATGFSSLTDGDEEFVFLGDCSAEEWLQPFLCGPTKLYQIPATGTREEGPHRPLRILVDRLPSWCRHMATNVPIISGLGLGEPANFDEVAELARVSLLHFTTQGGGVTRLPSIYHPHDLQHLHLPNFFSVRAKKARELSYRFLCRQATLVAVASSWIREDLVEKYHLSPSKVAVVPLAPPVEGYPIPTNENLESVRRKYEIDRPYIFYPAQTWPHKNHIRLLEAVAYLREQKGQKVNLICSGTKNQFFPTIEGKIHALNLSPQIKFVGFVSPLDLQCLYRLCRAVVIPTLFEAASFPLWESFHAKVPAACSSVTSLPRQAGDSALLFDPYSVASIANAIERVWTDDRLRESLVESGSMNVARFTWENTARLFRAHYRQILGRRLTNEDRALMSAAPLL